MTSIARIGSFLWGKRHGPESLALGTDTKTGKLLVLDDATLCQHISISGNQGTGMSDLMEQILQEQTQNGRGWVFLDPAGGSDVIGRLAEKAKSCGRRDEFYVLDLQNSDNSCSYDLLRGGSPNGRAVRAMQALPYGSAHFGFDSFSEEVRTSLQHNVLLSLFEAADASGRSLSLGNMAELLRELPYTGAQKELLDSLPVGHDARNSLNKAFSTMNNPQVVTAMCSLAKRLELLGAGSHGPLLDSVHPEIDFAEIFAQNKMCYIRMPTLTKSATSFVLARMILNDICLALRVRSTLPVRMRTPFVCLLNSFPSYGMNWAGDSQVPATDSTLFSQARSTNVSLIPVVDCSWGSLSKHFDGIENIIANTGTKLYFRQVVDGSLSQLHQDRAISRIANLGNGEFEMHTNEGHRLLRLAALGVTRHPAFATRSMTTARPLPRLRLLLGRPDENLQP